MVYFKRVMFLIFNNRFFNETRTIHEQKLLMKDFYEEYEGKFLTRPYTSEEIQ